MHIVINIDEEVYKRTLSYKDLPVTSNLANDHPELTHAVANGVPLPKGHGRLIDADRLKEVFSRNIVGGNAYFDLIDNAPTVEAIPKADYESRLADMYDKDTVLWMFRELQLEIEKHTMTSGVTNQGTWNECIACCSRVIQQKIDALKGE